jgi:regulator of nucleoside diphosphate kinase
MRPVITEIDNARLRGLMSTPVGRRQLHAMQRVLEKLNAAKIVPPMRVPSSIMTMNSTAACWDRKTGSSRELTLVYPWNARPAFGRVSVLSKTGVELLGALPGQVISLDDGTELKIAYVSFQPEAERQFHL